MRIATFRRAAGVITVADAERVIADLTTAGEIVPAGADHWTTRAMLAMEGDVLAWRQQRRTLAPPPRPGAAQLSAALSSQRHRRGFDLSAEQAGAVSAMLGGRFVAVTGEAGAGKGAVAAATADVWSAQHRRVIAVAVAGRTAQRLAADLGAGAEAMTLDGLMTRLEHGRLTLRDDDVIVLDEAGMVDTRRWARFVSVVKDRATVVALGDSAQLSPLSAGGLWPLLAEGGPRLRAVYRTRLGWEREAWQHLRRGDVERGLTAYAERGRLAVSETREASLVAAVEAWDRDGRDGVIITDASNAERDHLNALAQERIRDAGGLGGDAVALSPMSPRFHAGDPVIFRGQWRFADGRQRVENGITGTVIAVDSAQHMVTVRTDEPQPRDVEIVAAAGAVPLELGYAMHVYKAQGATLDRTYIVCGGWQTHRESLYVACSRSRFGSRVFLDSESLGAGIDADALTAIARRAERSRAKQSATSQRAAAEGVRKHSPLRPRHAAPVAHTPLVQLYGRRKRRRAADAAKRRHGAQVAYRAERRVRARRDGIRQMPQAVPEWALAALKYVTGRDYLGG